MKNFFRPLGSLPSSMGWAFLAAVVAILSMGGVNYQMHQERSRAADSLTHTLEVIEQIQSIASNIKDAESGQRGYLLTNAERYLDSYLGAKSSLPAQFALLRQLMGTDSQQLRRLMTLEQLITDKFDELEQTVSLNRSGNRDEAMRVVQTDRGRTVMNQIRQILLEIERQERVLSGNRRDEWNATVEWSVTVIFGGTALLLVLSSIGAGFAARSYRQQAEENWLRQGLAGLSLELQGDLRLDQLAEKALTFLADYLEAQIGAFYVAEGIHQFRQMAGFALEGPPGGLAAGADASLLQVGQGLLGQAVKENRILHIKDVPRDHVPVTSGIGRSQPIELLLCPASIDGRVQCVVELGFFRHLAAKEIELFQRLSQALAMSMRASKDRSQLEKLLEETQQQAEELQAQQEELRVNNEELEEQGRVLKESQARLENQQVELEQNNFQLERQARSLEEQKDELSQAQTTLAQRADQLERSSQYKSEFLANMSHELRTPLNSTLILAKLLADNKENNLTPEQVKFAQTIAAAGNDLLNLINDILDLSKIEAGKVEVDVQRVVVSKMFDGLQQIFEPVATQHGLKFNVDIDASVPQSIVTDESRCGQILKNLLSNACKFTEVGEVSVRVSNIPEQKAVRIDVRDTGIGIAPHQQAAIFEAFIQADGSTHRKYGGTGLGLSISRDLAHLLEGDLTVQSVVGEGSIFTLVLPWAHSKEVVDEEEGQEQDTSTMPLSSSLMPLPMATSISAPKTSDFAGSAKPKSSVGASSIRVVEDDRHQLQNDVQGAPKILLVIEDDVHFAAILRDLGRESGFKCVVTHSAQEGLDAARDYPPNAILLDMSLPDHSGLGVLDQLKRNSLTRHVPVHVLSVGDYSQNALQMGAVGYALKPVDREQLKVALHRLEDKLSQTLKRVLVVEDDVRQLESIQALLVNEDVEITGVKSAGEALQALTTNTFDCMVMDLSLPDMSGYELLERLADQQDGAFPPVIVYTGRSLTQDQEQRLGRFSKSIIIKGARSPERLLAEVTLFLHQIESAMPAERQRMLKEARNREGALEGRRVLIVEDDVRNIFALSAILEPKGVTVQIARNGREALQALEVTQQAGQTKIDLVLMDIMMPEMDGYTAMREIRKQQVFKKLPIIALTAKAMKDDQEKCLAAGANDYMAKPLDVERLLSLVRVWMPK